MGRLNKDGPAAGGRSGDEMVRVGVLRAVAYDGRVLRPERDGKKLRPIEAEVPRRILEAFGKTRLVEIPADKQAEAPTDKQVTESADK